MDLSYKDIDWRSLLVKCYKYYGLNEKDLAVILCLYDVLSSVDSLITPDDLVSYMTISKDEIDESLSKLMDKNFISIETVQKKKVTSLKPLLKRILSDLKKDIVIESNESLKKKSDNKVNELYPYFEDILGRPLTGRELDKISTWFKTGADEKLIKEAVEKLKAQSKTISLPAVDKVLIALQRNDDISKEGFSPRKDDWREGSEETLKIASTAWVNKN